MKLQHKRSSITDAVYEMSKAELDAQEQRFLLVARDVAVDGNRLGGRDPGACLDAMKAAVDSLPAYVAEVADCNAVGSMYGIALLVAAALMAMQQQATGRPVRDARAVLAKVHGGPDAGRLPLVQQAVRDTGVLVQLELQQQQRPAQRMEADEAWLQRVLAAIAQLASDDGAAASAAAVQMVDLMAPTVFGSSSGSLMDAAIKQLSRLFGHGGDPQPGERYDLLLNPPLRSSSGARDTPVMRAAAMVVQLTATYVRATIALPIVSTATVAEGERLACTCALPPYACCFASFRVRTSHAH